jgi:16S rRNA (cytidine1402-2'-O)-methyltransferase
VVPVPGPSALTAIVSVAGLPADRLVFEGFLPARRGPRVVRLRALADEPRALVFLETTRRLEAFLADAEAVLGDREAVIGRELTKKHEEFLRGTLARLRAEVRLRAALKGEVTVLVAGAAVAAAEAPPDLDAEIRAARAAGRGLREISTEIARRTGLSRRDVYRRALTLEREGGA